MALQTPVNSKSWFNYSNYKKPEFEKYKNRRQPTTFIVYCHHLVSLLNKMTDAQTKIRPEAIRYCIYYSILVKVGASKLYPILPFPFPLLVPSSLYHRKLKSLTSFLYFSLSGSAKDTPPTNIVFFACKVLHINFSSHTSNPIHPKFSAEDNTHEIIKRVTSNIRVKTEIKILYSSNTLSIYIQTVSKQ